MHEYYIGTSKNIFTMITCLKYWWPFQLYFLIVNDYNHLLYLIN